MSRTARLFNLIQLLRRHRYPVSGKLLAEELDVSLRTVYRDIASLQAQGAEIEGEPGMGYVMRPGFMLPPLMFSQEELEALVLGSRWVQKKTDSELSLAATNALAKIAAVLPEDLRRQLELSSLLVGPGTIESGSDATLVLIRNAIRHEHKIRIDYHSLKDQQTNRIIWPIGLGFFEKVRIVIAWCESRQDFRHFRTDRIKAIESCDERYPKRKHELLKRWRQTEKKKYKSQAKQLKEDVAQTKRKFKK